MHARSWLDAVGAALTVQQRLMWHSDIQTSLNIYGDVVDCLGIGQPTELRW